MPVIGSWMSLRVYIYIFIVNVPVIGMLLLWRLRIQHSKMTL